jgi:hypothetical protein
MRTITLNLTVQGDDYEELRNKAENSIAKFLGTQEGDEDFFDEEFVSESFGRINYELIVTQNNDVSKDFQYSAQVIAKVKDVRE